MDETTAIIRSFYDTDVTAEWNRIANRPEFLLTCRMLDRYINPGDRVLDIGGGPGRYSLHLAARGCDVTLFDLSPENTRFAAAEAAEQGLPLQTITGDARIANQLATGLFDHVLLMGPLYHLLEEADRAAAVTAALNLLKPGGMLFASFISMMGGIIYEMKCDPALIVSDNPADREYQENFVLRKSFAGDAFTKAFFIESGEILPFMSQFPIEKLHLFGQESITSPCEQNIMSQSPEIISAWLDRCEKILEREDLLSWSEHLMYVGRKTVPPPPGPDPEVQKEIEHYNALPAIFDGFAPLPALSDGEIFLVCTAKLPADPAKRFVPAYHFAICKGGEQIGDLNLRIGYTDGLYYGGQIGYNICESHRGNGYAARACRLLQPVAKLHGMQKLLISNDEHNTASRRVCEKLGARHLRLADLPQWHDLYQRGQRRSNIYEWDITQTP